MRRNDVQTRRSDRNGTSRAAAISIAALLLFGGLVVAGVATPAAAHITECGNITGEVIVWSPFVHRHDYYCDEDGSQSSYLQ